MSDEELDGAPLTLSVAPAYVCVSCRVVSCRVFCVCGCVCVCVWVWVWVWVARCGSMWLAIFGLVRPTSTNQRFDQVRRRRWVRTRVRVAMEGASDATNQLLQQNHEISALRRVNQKFAEQVFRQQETISDYEARLSGLLRKMAHMASTGTVHGGTGFKRTVRGGRGRSTSNSESAQAVAAAARAAVQARAASRSGSGVGVGAGAGAGAGAGSSPASVSSASRSTPPTKSRSSLFRLGSSRKSSPAVKIVRWPRGAVAVVVLHATSCCSCVLLLLLLCCCVVFFFLLCVSPCATLPSRSFLLFSGWRGWGLHDGCIQG